MMVSSRRARNAPQKSGADSATKEKPFGQGQSAGCRRKFVSSEGRSCNFPYGGYANIYRVDRNGPIVAWQLKKPSGYVPVPYISRSLNPFDPELSADQLLWPEGEKDVDTLDKANLPAFTFGGTGDGLTDYVKRVIADRGLLLNRHVIILADNDEAGRIHAKEKATFALSVGAASVRVIHFAELPEKGDVSDYFAAGGTAHALAALIRNAEQWSPKVESREATCAALAVPTGAQVRFGLPWEVRHDARLPDSPSPIDPDTRKKRKKRKKPPEHTPYFA
jgi:hypothetical protein